MCSSPMHADCMHPCPQGKNLEDKRTGTPKHVSYDNTQPGTAYNNKNHRFVGQNAYHENGIEKDSDDSSFVDFLSSNE